MCSCRFNDTMSVLRSGTSKIGGASLLWFLGYFNFSWLWIVGCKFLSVDT